MKKCSKCDTEKPDDCFTKLSTGKLYSSCKECKKNYMLARRTDNPELIKNQRKGYRTRTKEQRKETRRKWLAANPGKTMEYARKYYYGLTPKQYNEMFSSQEGRCYICSRHQAEFQKPLCVDHDHITNVVRGLLCHDCNIGLGMFKDNPSLLRKAAEYVEI